MSDVTSEQVAVADSAVMRAIVQHEWGGEEQLQYATAPRPEPLPTEILVRVEAAGVNPVDFYTREGLAYMSALSLPFIPGWDVAGVVEAVGYGVTRFRPGDEVFGMPWFPRQAGAYAEYVTAPARHFAPKPASCSFDGAAALPLAGLTAWQMLVDVAGVSPGDRVLVNGAAGGVGHLAVQIAKRLGATVVATARAANHDFVRDLGADEIIDYTTTDVVATVEPVDTVVELVGGDVCIAMLDALRPGGLLISAQAAWTPELTALAAARNVRATWYLVEPDPEGLASIAELVDAGDLRVHVGAVLPLSEARTAHRHLQDRTVTGKIVLRTR
jgi:NADPH:quinone reductase-like Zn-dependent oxidoreductase